MNQIQSNQRDARDHRKMMMRYTGKNYFQAYLEGDTTAPERCAAARDMAASRNLFVRLIGRLRQLFAL